MYEYRVAAVTRVVDGDTIDVIIDLGSSIPYHPCVRLAGIDTPESRTKDLEEKELGLVAKKHLEDQLASAASIVIKTQKDGTGKFGRILGWLFLDGAEQSVNEGMIASGYAWEYDGGTKAKDLGLLKTIQAESNLSL